jgi:hypothetical protein
MSEIDKAIFESHLFKSHFHPNYPPMNKVPLKDEIPIPKELEEVINEELDKLVVIADGTEKMPPGVGMTNETWWNNTNQAVTGKSFMEAIKEANKKASGGMEIKVPLMYSDTHHMVSIRAIDLNAAIKFLELSSGNHVALGFMKLLFGGTL